MHCCLIGIRNTNEEFFDHLLITNYCVPRLQARSALYYSSLRKAVFSPCFTDLIRKNPVCRKVVRVDLIYSTNRPPRQEQVRKSKRFNVWLNFFRSPFLWCEFISRNVFSNRESVPFAPPVETRDHRSGQRKLFHFIGTIWDRALRLQQHFMLELTPSNEMIAWRRPRSELIGWNFFHARKTLIGFIARAVFLRSAQRKFVALNLNNLEYVLHDATLL